MRRWVVLAVISLSTILTAQKSPVRAPSGASSPAPRWEKGIVAGRTYRNASVGLELTVADDLRFEEPKLMGTSGTVPELVTITAFRMETSSSSRNVTTFYADALGAYPESERSTESYMRKISRGNQETGYKLALENLRIALGGTTFARADFQGPLYEAVLAKSCGSQALVFIFASSSGKDDVEELINKTRLKLDPATSQCFSTTKSEAGGSNPK